MLVWQYQVWPPCVYMTIYGGISLRIVLFFSNRLDLDQIVPDESKQFDCPIVVLNRLEKVITFFGTRPSEDWGDRARSSPWMYRVVLDSARRFPTIFAKLWYWSYLTRYEGIGRTWHDMNVLVVLDTIWRYWSYLTRYEGIGRTWHDLKVLQANCSVVRKWYSLRFLPQRKNYNL